MLSARITGSGSYLPSKVLTNKDLEEIVDTTEDWIYSRSGIRQRHIAAEGEFTSDLALAASREALQSAGRAPSDVDLIVVVTTTADQVFPSTACLLQQILCLLEVKASEGAPAIRLRIQQKTLVVGPA